MTRMPLSRLACLAPLLALFLAGCATGRQDAPGDLVGAELALARADYVAAARGYVAAGLARRDQALVERGLGIAFECSQYRLLAELSRSWLAREPSSETGRRYLVVALLELDDRDAAERELTTLLKTAFPTPAEGLAAFGDVFGQLHNETGVAATVARVAQRYPDLPEGAYTVAQLALGAGDSPAALRAVDRALALKPGWRAARALRARARVAGGDCEAGLRESGELSADAGDGDRLLHAWLLGACQRGAEARAAFQDLLASRVARPEALEGLVGYDLDARRYDDATMRLSELLAAGRNAEGALFGLAAVADRRGEYPRAALLYARVQRGPRAVAAQLRAYRLLLEHGDAAGAARQMDEFVGAAPDYRVEASSGRAQILAELGRREEAEALLARLAATYPDRDEPRYAAAVVAEGAGRVDQAVALLRVLVARRPADPIALNALGYTLADHARSLPEAERLIRAAYAARPDSAAIRDSLGWVLHLRGRDEEALGWLERAQRDASDAEIALHLGLVQWALGSHAAARQTWQSALDRAPEERRLREVLAGHADAPP